VFAPLIIIAVALLSAAVVTYGCSPFWGQFSHGLAIIVFSRRFEGLLIGLSLLACIGLLMLIVSGRRRAWWLIALAPVLALFLHRFGPSRVHEWGVAVEDPPFVSAAAASSIQPDDYVVGLQLADEAYAYPYATLFRAPVIVQAGRSQRIVLMWSAYANRAVAMHASMEVRAADIEIVSTPANATLVYNGRTGQFINGITGETIYNKPPSGFGSRIAVAKMPWKEWLAAHPQTLVMDLHLPGAEGPTRPMDPICPMPPSANQIPDRRVALVGMDRPVAIDSQDLQAAPLNTVADGQPIMIFRASPASAPRAMVRRVGDLRPQFHLRIAANTPVPRHPKNGHGIRQIPGMFVDADTGSSWGGDGVWVSGPTEFKGTKLAMVPIDDDLDWRVMKYWYPDMKLIDIPHAPSNTLAVGE
jgi:hypothetical protein